MDRTILWPLFALPVQPFPQLSRPLRTTDYVTRSAVVRVANHSSVAVDVTARQGLVATSRRLSPGERYDFTVNRSAGDAYFTVQGPPTSGPSAGQVSGALMELTRNLVIFDPGCRSN